MERRDMKGYGIAHATLSVSNIQQTKKFYEDLFGVEFPMDDKISFSLLNVDIPCWFVESRSHSNDQFDETRIGLDHIAFKLEQLEELEQIIDRLNEMGIKNAGIEKFAGKFPYVAFRDPDNIQVEFFINNL